MAQRRLDPTRNESGDITVDKIDKNFTELYALAGVGSTPKNAAITTVGAGTLTGASIVGGVITRSGSTGAYSDATDTAANIITALGATAAVGESWYLFVLNTVQFQETITAGSGVTLSGPAVTAIGANCMGIFLCTYSAAGAVTMQLMGVVDRGIDNFNASADPTTTNDSTQGYGVGSIWFNTTAGALRWWECRDATATAAKWVFSGSDYVSGGTNPAAEQTQFGNGAALMLAEGNINRQISSAGVNPGATGADNVLAVFSLPASSFDIAGRGISITAQGSFAATANNKDVKIIFNPATAVVGSTVGAGGTTIADTGVVATNNLGWALQANVFKYGAGGSNTQIGLHQQAQVGAAVASMLKPSLITAVESGAILIAITGNATTAASDIVFNFMEVNALN